LEGRPSSTLDRLRQQIQENTEDLERVRREQLVPIHSLMRQVMEDQAEYIEELEQRIAELEGQLQRVTPL
jgi:polyhydroxyalkanoate synthesis regulator phasin